MASISSVGIGSGVLTSDLIDKLAAAEREPTEKRLDAKKEDIDAQLSEVARLKSALGDLRLTSRLLGNPESIKSNLISSSSSAISGVANESAAPGQYKINVTNLAQAHSMASGVYADGDTTTLGTGTLQLTQGGVTRNITIDSSNNTLQGIADSINALSNRSATAAVINTGSGYQLVLSADEEGEDNEITLAVIDNDGDSADDAGLSQLTSGALALTEVVAAEDLAFTVNGVAVTRSSNEVDDLLGGVTLTFTEETTTPAVLKITRDTETVSGRVQELVDKYNALQAIVAETTKYDAATGEAGILLGESSVRAIGQQTRAVIYGLVKGLENANVRSLADLGISTDKETGQLSFDSTRFKSQLNKYPDDVAAVFAEQGRASDSQVKFQTASVNTVVGTYEIAVTVAATQGVNAGSVAISAATTTLTTINSDNDNFVIQVDGTSSGSITLDAGDYTDDGLVAELQAKIDADTTLLAAGKSVVVSLDDSNQLVFTSRSFGSASAVNFTSVDTNTAAELGFSVSTGTAGTDVAGTINGATATGSGKFLTAATDDDSRGIVVEVSGTTTGSRGTVSYIEGVGDQLVDVVTNFIKFDGILSSYESRLNTQLTNIKDERASMETRIKSLTTRLAKQFTAADILVAQFKNTGDFLTNQLASLNPGSNK
jgi:flagellar hook-associated protein 2